MVTEEKSRMEVAGSGRAPEEVWLVLVDMVSEGSGDFVFKAAKRCDTWLRLSRTGHFVITFAIILRTKNFQCRGSSCLVSGTKVLDQQMLRITK